MKKELKCLSYYLENIGPNLRVTQLFPLLCKESIRKGTFVNWSRNSIHYNKPGLVCICVIISALLRQFQWLFYKTTFSLWAALVVNLQSGTMVNQTELQQFTLAKNQEISKMKKFPSSLPSTLDADSNPDILYPFVTPDFWETFASLKQAREVNLMPPVSFWRVKEAQWIFLFKISPFSDHTGWLLSFFLPRLDTRKTLYSPGEDCSSPVPFPRQLAEARYLGKIISIRQAWNDISTETEVSKKQSV